MSQKGMDGIVFFMGEPEVLESTSGLREIEEEIESLIREVLDIVKD